MTTNAPPEQVVQEVGVHDARGASSIVPAQVLEAVQGVHCQPPEDDFLRLNSAAQTPDLEEAIASAPANISLRKSKELEDGSEGLVTKEVVLQRVSSSLLFAAHTPVVALESSGGSGPVPDKREVSQSDSRIELMPKELEDASQPICQPAAGGITQTLMHAPSL